MTLVRPFRLFLLAIFFGVAGTISWFNFDRAQTNEQRAAKIEKRVSRALSRAEKEADWFVQNDPEWEWAYYHFLIEGSQITKWSTHLVVPDLSMVDERPLQLHSGPKGHYLVRYRSLGVKSILTLIPLQEKFRITNRYLQNEWNPHIFSDQEIDILDPESHDGVGVRANGNLVFKIKFNEGSTTNGITSFVLISLASIFFLLAGWVLLRELVARKKYGSGFLLLLVACGLLRLGMIRFAFPEAWTNSPVFDATTFASSAFNASLGDLFLNAIYVLILCVYLFRYFFKFEVVKKVFLLGPAQRGVAGILFLVLAFFGFLFPFLFFETLANNSSIELDWTQSLLFNEIRLVAYVSILIGLICSFLFCHVFAKAAFQAIGRDRNAVFLAGLFVAAFLIWLYSMALARNYTITLVVGSAFFCTMYFTSWDRRLTRITFLTFVYLIVAILFQAAQSALTVQRVMAKRSQESLYRFGANYLINRDVLGEYLLSEASSRISEDPFIQTRLTNPFFGKGSIRQKIRLIYLNSYFDRYEAQVHLFSVSGEPLDDQSQVGFAQFITQFQEEAGRTDYRGVYFVEQAHADLARSYVAVVPVFRSNRNVGYITIVLALKKVVPRSVYPQLLLDNRFAQGFRSSEHSYALFRRDSLISSSGDFDYQRNFQRTALSSPGWSAGGYQHVVIEGDNGLKAVVTGSAYSFFKLVSNFSFWTFLGVVVVLFWLVGGSFYYYRSSLRLNYAARVQLYVYIAFILPLIAVSITTLNWTSRSARDQLESEFINKARVLSEKVAPVLEQTQIDASDENEFGNYLSETAKLASVDASIYTPQGRLFAASQPLIFDNQIISKWMNPRAFEVIRNSESSFIVEEKVGSLVYNNSYSSILSPQSGRLIGILSVPFFESAYSLEKGRITILSNVLIIFVIILILFTLLSFVATNWLTFPLQLITKSLSRTSLKGENRLLDWEANDEIGLMAREYNRMVRNLEKSKIDLARSQKESAWREMAQQVAHEIKNPLTPMKLTLQQMESNFRADNLSKEKVEKSIDTLLAQVEILNDIASSFSSFAKLPAPILHRLELNKAIKKVVDLYQNHASGQVTWEDTGDRVFILADVQLLSRVLSNLVLNGLQSGKEGELVRVKIKLETENLVARIRVEDNGRGIEEAVKEKVFIPHFTTKKSGSGLGLAIAKQGIEQSGGTIYFHSSAGEGTTFILEFPLV